MKKIGIKKLRYPTNRDSHEYMRMRQWQNLEQCKTNRAEDWMAKILKRETDLKWNRQAQWGYRLFDFWNSKLGVAVEVDGDEHDQSYDSYRDKYNFERSGIIVLRVRNFDEVGANQVIKEIKLVESWFERRLKMGLLTKSEKLKQNDKQGSNTTGN